MSTENKEKLTKGENIIELFSAKETSVEVREDIYEFADKYKLNIISIAYIQYGYAVVFEPSN